MKNDRTQPGVPPSRCINSHIVELMQQNAYALETLVATDADALNIAREGNSRLLKEARRALCDKDAGIDGTSIVTLYRIVARAHPAAVAIRFGTREISHRQLNMWSSVVANRLVATGCTPGTVVAIQTARSPEMIAAVLGVLKAGCAFIFCDPQYPLARRREMLAACSCTICISDDGRDEGFGRVLRLSDLIGESFLDHEPTLPSIDPDSDAYLMFTSGSSGLPKVVAGTHRALVGRLHAMWRAKPFEASEACIFRKSFGFIGSLTELFEPLLQGIPIELVADNAVADPSALVSLLAQRNITRFWCFPPLLRAMLRVCKLTGAELPQLRYCFSSGEPLDTRTVREFRRMAPNAELINIYGTTEVCSDVAFYAVKRADEHRCIGRPMFGCRLYVLDTHMELLPIGVPGELYVGGDFVANGYRGQDASGGKFFDDPFSSIPDRKLFRTGDRAILDEAGNYTVLGRLNTEVKIHGFRISLQEVEATLQTIEGIGAAAATVRGTDANPRLAVYFECPESNVPSVAILRQKMRESLPAHMVPAEFWQVECLPKTANGKLDRAALAHVEARKLERLGTGSRVPTGHLERAIASIWRAAIDIEEFGLDETFDDVGGTSIAAFTIIAKIRERLSVDVSLAEFFDHGSVRKLAHLIKTKQPVAKQAVSLPRNPVEQLPLTEGQMQMWMAATINPHGASYGMCSAVRIRGISRTVLLDHLRRLFVRHAALRTRVGVLNGIPFQQIDDQFRDRIVELTLETVEARYGTVGNCCNEELKTIPGSDGRLSRVILIGERSAQWLVCVLTHHMICDGWSMRVLLQDFRLLVLQKRLRKLDFEYDSWITERHRRESSDNFAPEYWRQRLLGIPPTSTFRSERPRDLRSAQTTAREKLLFSLAETQNISRICARLNVTVNQFFIAALGIVLGRFADQTTVTIGVPLLGRATAAEHSAVGLFMNTLPFRMDVGAEHTFRRFCSDVKRTLLSDFEHGLVAASKIFTAAGIERVTAVSTGFQVLFTAYDFTPETATASDTRIELQEIALDRGAKLDASFSLYTGGHLELCVDYSPARYQAKTAAIWLEAISNIASTVSANLDMLLADIGLCGGVSRANIFRWNRTDTSQAGSAGLVERIAERIRQNPSAPAVYHKSDSYDYRTLSRIANGIAYQLKLRLPANGTPFVPLLMDRCIDLPPAILGILGAGCAFVPIDPRLPESLRRQLLVQIGSPVAVTSAQCLPLLAGAEVHPIMPGEHLDAPTFIPTPALDDPIYAIFTSGSTGIPKAAINLHRGILNRFDWMTAEFGANAGSCTVQTTHHCYDSSVWQILWPLTLGGAAVIPEAGRETDATYLRDLVSVHKVSIIDYVPSVLKALVPQLSSDSALRASVASLQVVIIGGEELGRPLAQKAKELFAPATVVNLYGPTETSIGCIFHRFGADDDGRIPIGRPIANTRAIILDAQGHICPPGLIGELCLGGACVGGGYLGKPDLTVRAFVRNTVPELACDTLYKTGDMAAYRADGTIDFFGRRDHQIKIRGHRVEVGEIETAIKSVPQVRQVALEVEKSKEGEATVVAYIVPESPSTSAELRRLLTKALPAYAVPKDIFICTHIPIAGSGKLDRAKLRTVVSEDASPPISADDLNPTTTVIKQIWETVLGHEVSDTESNFFDQGGNSLMVPTIFAEISKYFPSLTMVDLLHYPSIAALGREIEARGLGNAPVGHH